MTDAQAALAQVREALAAGPTPGPWFAVNDGNRTEPFMNVKAERISGRGPTHEVAICATGDSPQSMETANARYIAACSPVNMTAILAHVEAQEAEVKRLRAAVTHEADCVDAAKAEIERLTAENKMLRHTHRWNVSPQVDDSLLVCRGVHEEDEKCDLEHYVPAERLHDAIRERDELRRKLAEAEQTISDLQDALRVAVNAAMEASNE